MRTATAPLAMATASADLFSQAQHLGLEELHLFFDPRTRTRAVIAIHSTRLGPALGGCRFLPYPSTDAAVTDAMRLARAMSYKAAVARLNHGGGKAVLLRPERLTHRRVHIEAFASFVQRLGGRYITAEDSGTDVFDMDTIARYIPYVVGTSKAGGDPAPHTAFGVCKGIQAAVKFWLGRDDLEGVRVAIQGAGNVGYKLARELAELGAILIVADTNGAAAERVAHAFGGRIVAPDLIWEVPCDVFAPCALGGVLDSQTARRIKARIIAGAANNQLRDPGVSELLQEREILYAPDFVINAGGLIHLALRDENERHDKLLGIYDTLMAIFRRARRTGQTPVRIAERMAEAVVYGPRRSVRKRPPIAV